MDYYKQNKGLVLEEEDSKVLQVQFHQVTWSSSRMNSCPGFLFVWLFYRRVGLVYKFSIRLVFDVINVLQIMVATGRNDALPVRNFLQVESFIDNCSAWIPPHGSGYSSVNCFGYKFGTDFFEDLKAIRKADILVSGAAC